MKYYKNYNSNAWSLRIKDIQVTIQIEVQETWMEHDFEMISLHLFQIHWPYDQPKALLTYVDYVTFKFME